MLTEATEIASSWGLAGIPLAVVGFVAWLLKEPLPSLIKAKEVRLKEQELFYKLVEANSLDGQTRKVLLESVVRREFKRAYDLDLTPNERAALIQLFEENEPNIRWHHIRNAFSHIRFLGPTVSSVEISVWERIAYRVCLAFSLFLICLSVLLFIVSSAAFVLDSVNVAGAMLLVGMIYFIPGCIFGGWYMPYVHAKKIRFAITRPTSY